MSARAPIVIMALFAAGCGLLSGLDALVVDAGTSAPDANDASVASDVLDDFSADGPGLEATAPTFSLMTTGGCSTIGNDPLSLSNDVFTIELWLQLSTAITSSEIDPILWKGGRSTNEPGWTLAETSSGIQFCISDSSTTKCTPAYAQTVGHLVHLGIVSTFSNQAPTARAVQLYARDVSIGEKTHFVRAQFSTGAPDTWTALPSFTLGGAKVLQCASAPSFVIDDLRIYTSGLQPTDFDTDMASDAPCSATSLVAAFKFDEGSGKTTHDCSSNKLSMTLGTNATFVARPFP